jgi:glycosyltransferase involved in cell wall biosynthesis
VVIQFLLPIAGIAGGTKVVYEYANYMAAHGHTVRILYPGVVSPEGRKRWRLEAGVRHAKYGAERLLGKNEAKEWFPLKAPLMHVPSLEARYVPDADATIATGNETAGWAARLPERCGTAFYFIQGYETWNASPEVLEATYRLPLKKIVIAQFLEEIVKNAGEHVVGIAPNGVDMQVFFDLGKTLNQPRQILMLSHDAEEKGIPDGFQAVTRAREEFPDLRLVMFGAHHARADMLPGTEYHQAPPVDQLRKLYASSDIFLCPSWQEAWGLPAMEAMACGTAVVTTAGGGILDFSIAGETVLVSPPRDPEALAAALLRLLRDESLLVQIGYAGHDYIQRFKLGQTAAHFTRLVLDNA